MPSAWRGELPLPRGERVGVRGLRPRGSNPLTPALSPLEKGEDHDAPGFSRKRWIFPVGVFGSASMNFTERGYLNGAMVALT